GNRSVPAAGVRPPPSEVADAVRGAAGAGGDRGAVRVSRPGRHIGARRLRRAGQHGDHRVFHPLPVHVRGDDRAAARTGRARSDARAGRRAGCHRPGDCRLRGHRALDCPGLRSAGRRAEQDAGGREGRRRDARAGRDRRRRLPIRPPPGSIMNKPILLSLSVLLIAAPAVAAPQTMRVDYYHTGNATEEHYSLDQVVIEPLPWPGNPARPMDGTNRGKYFFEIADAAGGTVLYSRGFSSIYGEWETTGEAKELKRTFSESLRFPAPDKPFRIVVRKRDARNVFRDIWTFTIDPADKFVTRGVAAPDAGPLLKLHESGDPAKKLDFLILGDGYTARERGKFERDARRLVNTLLATSPFKERRGEINIWGLAPAATQSGVSRPSQHIYRRSPVGATYDAFDSERYVLTFENKAFRDLAANAPYEVVEILVNSATYGGGGIYGLYSTVAADSVWAPYIFVHEFGHHIAGLADEYYTSDVAYLPAADRVEPWEPNATAMLDPAALKWKDLVTPGTPVPTPWPKEEFEAYTKEIQQKRRAIRAANRPESEMDALFREEEKRDTALLNEGPHAGKVGAFEGANYEARGSYRPQADCIMFTRDNVPFCVVCRRAIDAILDLYTSP